MSAGESRGYVSHADSPEVTVSGNRFLGIASQLLLPVSLQTIRALESAVTHRPKTPTFSPNLPLKHMFLSQTARLPRSRKGAPTGSV